MPMKHGTHLGGVRTLEDLQGRCDVNEINGCWHLLTSRRKRHKYEPGEQLRIHVFGRGRMIAKRAAWELAGREVKDGHYVMRCLLSWDCCNPEHLRSMKPARVFKRLASAGLSTSPRKRAALKKQARSRKSCVLTMELAQWARESTQTQTDAAHGLGVSQARVSDIRTGKTWVDRAWGGLFHV